MSGSGKGGKLQPRMTKVNPRAEIVKLAEKRKELQRDLEVLETQIYNYEGTYLKESPHGNVVRGWGVRPPNDNEVPDSDRLFSMSSVTSKLGQKMMQKDTVTGKKRGDSRSESVVKEA
eukprot:m.210865 g.210865  ORF g.210865 m.210865 type:complete len:118 (+) comp15828_c0_seq2:73-426(+)